MSTITPAGDGAIVAALMQAAGITEHALAVKTGIPLTTLRRRIAGADFTASELRKVAVALGTTAAAILAAAERGAA